MPAEPEAAGTPSGGGGGRGGDAEQEFVVRNDEGFVYKVAGGLYPDAAPSPTQRAAVPDPRAAGLRRRRAALLRIRAKRLRGLARWEALASELVAPHPAPQAPAALPAPSQPDAALASSSSSSASVLDDLLAEADRQTELMKIARQWCDKVNGLCDAHEAAMVDSIAPLPLWGRDPKELIAGLCSPQEHSASGYLDEQNVHQKASGVSSAHEMIKKGARKKKIGHGLPSPILTESRTRKRVTNLSGSTNVAPQVSIETKRKKASGSTSTGRGTPVSSAKRKAESTPARPIGIVCSPGPVTRQRAAK